MPPQEVIAMPRTSAKLDRKRQLKATTGEKLARQKEAGLAGKRTGEVSASARRAQARRDSRREAAHGTARAWPADAPRAADHLEALPAKTRRDSETSRFKIEVNTDRNIAGSQDLKAHVRDKIAGLLKRFTAELTRVDVHLSDENAAKTRGDDKRCVIEARAAGQRPISATHVGATVDQAVDRAARKMARQLTALYGKLRSRRGALGRRAASR
jgi:ribosomal subunit interface protein